ATAGTPPAARRRPRSRPDTAATPEPARHRGDPGAGRIPPARKGSARACLCAMTDGVRVELLGPLRLVVDGVEVPVPGPKRRAVLALLALAEGRAVTVDQLLEALWPGDDAGRAALQTHVSRLRSHLGGAADRLVTLPEAYRLAVDSLDL